jgi:hypothetical protein
MTPQDKQAIAELFAKLEQVARQAPTRDGEAEALIRDRMAAQPGAAYYMAQTIVVQEHALEMAQQRIGELEQQAAARPASGGFLSGLLGGRNESRTKRPMPMQAGYGQPWAGAPGRGSGFLAGAAQTAMGVAGGVLLGNMVAGMFAGDGANAAGGAHSGAQAEPAAADQGFEDFGSGEEEI